MSLAEEYPDHLARPIRLTGRGLVLREWADADLPAMTDLFDEPDIAEYTNIPSPFDPGDYLAMIRRTRAEDNRLHLAITKDGRAPLGLAFFSPARGEVGYVVGKAHRRQGLAVRATRLLTEFGHDVIGLPRLTAQIIEGNTPSLGVARAAGAVGLDHGLPGAPDVVDQRSDRDRTLDARDVQIPLAVGQGLPRQLDRFFLTEAGGAILPGHSGRSGGMARRRDRVGTGPSKNGDSSSGDNTGVQQNLLHYMFQSAVQDCADSELVTTSFQPEKSNPIFEADKPPRFRSAPKCTVV